MNDNTEVARQIAEQYPLMRHIGLLALIGCVVGLGQALADQSKPTTKTIIGRALTSAGMGVCAAGVITYIPGLPLAAECGIAALMASMGTSGLTLLMQKFFGTSGGK